MVKVPTEKGFVDLNESEYQEYVERTNASLSEGRLRQVSYSENKNVQLAINYALAKGLAFQTREGLRSKGVRLMGEGKFLSPEGKTFTKVTEKQVKLPPPTKAQVMKIKEQEIKKAGGTPIYNPQGELTGAEINQQSVSLQNFSAMEQARNEQDRDFQQNLMLIDSDRQNLQQDGGFKNSFIYRKASNIFERTEPYRDKVFGQIQNSTFINNLKASDEAETLTKIFNYGKQQFEQEVQEPLKDFGTQVINPYLESKGKTNDQGVLSWASEYFPEKAGTFAKESYEKYGPKHPINLSFEYPKSSLTTIEKEISPVFEYAFDKPKNESTTKFFTGYNFSNLIPSRVQVTPELVGKTTEVTAKVGQYFVPYYGEAIIFGPAVESTLGGPFGGEKSLKEYVVAHPYEASFVALYGGAKAFLPIKSYFATFGRENINIQQLVPKNVLSGIERFPSAGSGSYSQIAKEHLRIFKQGKYSLPNSISTSGYHATEKVFWEGGKTSIKDPLHISSAVSTNFLKLSNDFVYPKSVKEYFKSFLTPFQNPGVLSVTPQDFRINIGKEVKRGKYVWNKPPVEGVADIPGTKTEIQAVISIGDLQLESQKYYTTYKGVRIPIDEASVIKSGSDSKSLSLPKFNDVGSVSSYSGFPSLDYSGYKSLVATLPSIKSSSSSYKSTTIFPSSISGSTSKSKISTPSYVSTPSSSSPKSKIPLTLPSIIPSFSKSYAGSSRTSPPPTFSSSIPKYTKYPKPPIPIERSMNWIFKSPTLPRRQPRLFRVFGRRFGKFKFIGFGKSEKQAFNIGKEWAKKGLGVTFKVQGATARKLPQFKTKLTKQGTLYLQKPKYRLSRKTEVKEIQFFKGLKGGKKKKKNLLDLEI